VRLAQRHGVKLRQSYARVGRFALIKYQRYAHAKQFKRANRALKTLRTYLGRVIRDVARKIEGDGWIEEMVFGHILPLARQVREQTQRQRGPKVYSLHAPEVECIGKGKAHRPYEFGVKVSVATTLAHAKGGQLVTHVKALPGNPYDGHTLATVIPEMEALVGNTIERILADKGYRGHNAPPRLQIQGVHVRSEAPGDPEDQARVASALRRRAGHRPSQIRTSYGPQLPLVPTGRRHQCGPGCRGLQLPPPHPLAGALAVPNPRPADRSTSAHPKLKSTFFTDD
jgi:transposase, IS5 family